MRNKILVGILIATCSSLSYMAGVSRAYSTAKKELTLVFKRIEKEIKKSSQEEILEQDIED